MEILAKGTRIQLNDGDAISNLRFTAEKLAQKATQRPDYKASETKPSGLAASLWAKLEYVCNPDEQQQVQSIFSEALTAALTDKPDSTQDAPTVSTPEDRSISSDAPTTVAAPSPVTSKPEPFRFDHCTVTLTVTLLPVDTSTGSRRAVVGVRTHDTAPVISCSLVGGATLAADVARAIENGLENCRQEMPLRAAENLRSAAAKTTRRKSSPRGSKSGSGANNELFTSEVITTEEQHHE